jgi:glycerophosphoryl diester phosphodiesterase
MCHAPENTLAAFEKAIEFGTYRIEFDVRRCGSGEIVVMHDAALDRTTDATGPVAARTLTELKRVKVGGTEPIPTLEETLACAKGRARLLVEIKEPGLAEDVVARITAAGMTDACTIASFHEDELLRVKALDPPGVATAYFLTEPKPFDAEEIVARFGVALLVVWPRAASAEIIAAAKRAGLDVRCGFRDDLTYEETWTLFRQMADWGVDEMACGRPDWIRRMSDDYAAAASAVSR